MALALLADYGSDAAGEQTAWSRVERQLAACPGAEPVGSFSDPSGAEGHTYRIAATQSEVAPEYVWIVSTGQAIGALKVFGQSDPLPAANDRTGVDGEGNRRRTDVRPLMPCVSTLTPEYVVDI